MLESKTPVKESMTTENALQVIELLKVFSRDPLAFAQLPEAVRIELLKAAGELSRPNRVSKSLRKAAVRKEKHKSIVKEERRIRAETGIRQARTVQIFQAPERVLTDQAVPAGRLSSPRNCYICKAEYTQLHFFYDQLCPSCAAFNYDKRFQTTSLEGQVALITGSRLKIGYQAALMMLRAGARVIATTRFPKDSAMRYSREADFERWKDRLHIYGLDLRHTPSVEIFCRYFEKKYRRLDLLINNAAQTVRRPPGFYAHLMAGERLDQSSLSLEARQLLCDFEECKSELHLKGQSRQVPSEQLRSEPPLALSWTARTPGIGLQASAELSQIPYVYDDHLPVDQVFPRGQFDCDLQQVDLRTTNSWRLKLGEVETSELLEIQLVNAVAPFVLCNKLVPLMKQQITGCKHIVNVSAMEGKFLRFKKAARHPHTNMAKAALNMLTHTAAADLALYGIFINAVDTGWVTDEDPVFLSALKQDVHDFQPPLDIVDGAARVCDPFFHGLLSKTHWSGKFLKDYFPIDW